MVSILSLLSSGDLQLFKQVIPKRYHLINTINYSINIHTKLTFYYEQGGGYLQVSLFTNVRRDPDTEDLLFL